MGVVLVRGSGSESESESGTVKCEVKESETKFYQIHSYCSIELFFTVRSVSLG